MGIVNNARFFFQQGPLHLLFYPTSQSNLFCKHCFNYDRQDNLGGDTGRSDELSLDEIEQISYKFGNLKSLTVTGGEPFLRKDIVK